MPVSTRMLRCARYFSVCRQPISHCFPVRQCVAPYTLATPAYMAPCVSFLRRRDGVVEHLLRQSGRSGCARKLSSLDGLGSRRLIARSE
eukprot:3209067-Rhodomonas_salina.2